MGIVASVILIVLFLFLFLLPYFASNKAATPRAPPVAPPSNRRGNNVVENLLHKIMEPQKVYTLDVTALDGLALKIQFTKINESIKYFIENPHKNLWINGKNNLIGLKKDKLSKKLIISDLKGNFDGDLVGSNISLRFKDDEEKANRRILFFILIATTSFLVPVYAVAVFNCWRITAQMRRGGMLDTTPPTAVPHEKLINEFVQAEQGPRPGAAPGHSGHEERGSDRAVENKPAEDA